MPVGIARRASGCAGAQEVRLVSAPLRRDWCSTGLFLHLRTLTRPDHLPHFLPVRQRLCDLFSLRPSRRLRLPPLVVLRYLATSREEYTFWSPALSWPGARRGVSNPLGGFDRIAAPLLLIFLRISRACARRESGGAAIYVPEHSGRAKRAITPPSSGSVAGPRAEPCLSACVRAGCGRDLGLLGLAVRSCVAALLAISLWMRFKLAESPAFKAMKKLAIHE